ncbi:MAG: YezD family protein [Verrucomicrobia bacterium]|nr:YezD family protein [Verrucomicrobiota bacterium]
MRNEFQNQTQDHEPRWLQTVRAQVESLRFGVVQIVVHDSRVTQIERTERVRLEDRSEKK